MSRGKSTPFHTFIVRDQRFLFDIESSKVYEISESAYDAVSGHETSSFEKGASILERIGLSFEWKFLRATTCPSSKRELAKLKSALDQPPGVLQGLWLGVAHTCNLDCKYCFANEPAHLGTNRIMSREVAERGVRFLLDHSGDTERLDIIFFGGEPLLNTGVIQETVDICNVAGEASNKKFIFSTTTNGTLLTAEKFEWLSELGISVMVSLDGTKEIQDRNRRTKKDEPTWDTIVNNLSRISNFGDHIIVRATIPEADSDQVAILRNLLEIGFRDVVLGELCPNSGKLQPNESEKDLVNWEKRYLDLADYVIGISQTIADIPESGLRRAVNAFLNPYRTYYCCDTGRRFFYLDPVGDIYPCFRIMTTDARYRLGSLESGINPALLEPFAVRHVLNTECSECWARYLCGGPCYGDSFALTGDITTPFESFCRRRKFMFQAAAYVLSSIAKKDKTLGLGEHHVRQN